MASPGDTFKSNLFGQLKSYTNAVQGAFEQRIGKWTLIRIDHISFHRHYSTKP